MFIVADDIGADMGTQKLEPTFAQTTKHAQPGDKEATVTAQLTTGSHQLAPTFVNDAGNEIEAYCAIIKGLP